MKNEVGIYFGVPNGVPLRREHQSTTPPCPNLLLRGTGLREKQEHKIYFFQSLESKTCCFSRYYECNRLSFLAPCSFSQRVVRAKNLVGPWSLLS